MKLSQRMREAIELLKQEEFYLMELPDWFMWKAYNLPGQTIRTDTMKALEKRGVVKIEVCSGGRYSYAAKLINPPNPKVF